MADDMSSSDDNIIISRKKARLEGSQKEEEEGNEDSDEDEEEEEESNDGGDDSKDSTDDVKGKREEDDGEEYNDYEDEIPVCYECGGTPCQWTEFGSDLLENFQEMYVTSMQSSQDGEVHTIIKDRSSGHVIPNNLVRKMLYRTFTLLKYGHKGHSNFQSEVCSKAFFSTLR
jgi:cobalamin biosynthesis protein CobT